ncbi:MAG: putative Glutamate racemase [Candidatus Saccharibacteria bacterium]|nr:putative Glutamate racemase [Candidatus Saccharibacteria bacterium]
MKIGVFDSGAGGLSVSRAIERALPEHEVIFRNDAKHVPYGTRSPDEVLGFVLPILQSLVDDGCVVIVIACNTVSTTLIKELRERFTVPLVAVEPMVKPAAQLTKSGVIAVCATPATLASKRYAWLKQAYATDITILEPDCSDWSQLIEDRQIDEQKIADTLRDVLVANADVIVLGCTHYHWIEDEIITVARGRATVLHPEQPVIRQLKRVLAQLA